MLRETDWHRIRLVANLMIADAALYLVMTFVHGGDFQATGLAIGVYTLYLAAFGLVGVVLSLLQRELKSWQQVKGLSELKDKEVFAIPSYRDLLCESCVMAWR